MRGRSWFVSGQLGVVSVYFKPLPSAACGLHDGHDGKSLQYHGNCHARDTENSGKYFFSIFESIAIFPLYYR